MSDFMDKLDAALEEQRARSEDWLKDTHIRKDAAPPRDVFAPEPKEEPAAEPEPFVRNWDIIQKLGADADEVAWRIEEDEAIQSLPPGDRLEAAARADVSERLWLEGRYEDATAVAFGGNHPELQAFILRQDNEDEFDEVIAGMAEQAGQEAFEAGAEALKAGIESNRELQTAEGAEILAGLLAGGETFDADQMQALVDAAGRGARQQRIESEHAAILEAWDEGLRQSPYSSDSEDSVRDLWAPPSPSREERELAAERDSINRLGSAMLAGKPLTAAEQVAAEWAPIEAREREAEEEWSRIQRRAYDLGQKAAIKKAEGGR